MSQISRREFLTTLSAIAATTACTAAMGETTTTVQTAIATSGLKSPTSPGSPFQVGVFTDEITDDLARACEIAAREFGLRHVELRAMWKKNIIDLTDQQIREAKDILQHHNFSVTSIAGPLYKVDWPGAPRSKHSPDKQPFNANVDWSKQDAVLDREIELAGHFGTKHIRCFDFWRLDDPAPFRAAMDEKLIAAAEKAAKHGLTLVMENEHACNTATAKESVRTLAAVTNSNFKLNWDPGNSALSGETAFPDGYNMLPKNRLGHVHCKNLKPRADGKLEWCSMADGTINYTAQFAALRKDGFTGPVVLETHWRLKGDKEKATRQCMQEMQQQLNEAMRS